MMKMWYLHSQMFEYGIADHQGCKGSYVVNDFFNVKGILLIFCFCFMSLFSIGQHRSVHTFTKGVYGDPSVLTKSGTTFRSLGINAIFVRSVSINPELVTDARNERVRVYVEFPTLNGKDYVESHPEAWPINERGEREPAADWFMGVCPTDSGFREFRQQQLRTLLSENDVDGVWLDYVHWHAQFETPDPILPETCFCSRCVERFQTAHSTEVPAGDLAQRAQWILANADSVWRLWRTEVLTNWVSDIKTILKREKPDALLGIYYCPWYPEDFNGALYRVLGIDVKKLAGIVDVLSPMLYHHMMDRSPEWVGEYIQRLKTDGITDGRRTLIWPIVQAHNKPGVISTEEFRSVMWNGSRSPASGIMMFTLQTLMSEPGKLQVMKDLYRKR